MSGVDGGKATFERNGKDSRTFFLGGGGGGKVGRGDRGAMANEKVTLSD